MAEGTSGPGDPAGDKWDLIADIGRAFSPAAPIDNRDLFAGRAEQMAAVIDVVYQRGQHAVIYGERGVGKTSLASVMSEVIGRPNLLAPRVNCDGTDNFSTIWQKVLEEIQVTDRIHGIGFRPEVREAVRTAADFLPAEEPTTPNDVRKVLQLLGETCTTVVFVDEFDRMEDEEARRLFADTIKTLSDQLVPASIILVGVADNVDELIAEHRSVERAIVQVHMPRMSLPELSEIVKRGLDRVEMTITDDALNRIIEPSLGLPHYTHLLAQSAARAAVDLRRREVRVKDVDAAMERAIERAQESIIDAYHRATFSTRDTLYPQVLLASALADEDDLGYFAASDVREPLSTIMRRPYDIPAFSRHLNALCEPERGPVLQKKGHERRFRFRFLNPLLQPYVIMRGLASEMINAQVLGQLRGPGR